MAVTDIYVLPSNYPKFDWADWPESAAALVPDGYTHEFEKEAWNAIVDLLARVLAETGEAWSNTYTTAAGARITEEYGDLRAAAINSVRHNIDTTVPVLRWGWANDPTFRGYIGRKDFRGVDAYGEAGADDVYPEYIVELAARLNLMLSVMTGEAARVLQVESVVAARHSAELLAKLPYALAGGWQSQSIHEAFGRIRLPRLLSTEQLLKSKCNATLRRGVAAQMWHEYILLSDYKGRMAKPLVVQLGRHQHNFVSKYLAEMDVHNARPIAAKQRIWSQEAGSMARLLSFPLGSFRGVETTLYIAESAAAQSLRLSGRYRSASGHSAEFTRAEVYPVTAQSKVTSIYSSRLGAAHNIGLTEGESKTSNAVSLDSAWWPPEWQTDGGLWIRQSHEVTHNDGVLEVV